MSEDSKHLAGLCFNLDWEAALERVRTHPKEAAEIRNPRDKDESALHWCCYYGAPVELLEAVAAAAPELVDVSRGWHSQGLPLDCLLNRCYYFVKPDLKDKVLALLKANTNAAKLSIYTAFCRIGGAVKKTLEKYPDRFPDDGPFSYRQDERTDEEKEHTPLTINDQLQLVWDVFELLVKVAYYKTVDCESLPLVHALADLPFMLSSEEDGIRNWHYCPDMVVQFAARLRPEELLIPVSSGTGDLPLHLAIKRSKPRRLKDDWEDWSDYYEEFGGPQPVYDAYNVSKIQILAKACPEAAKIANGCGELPLHVAIKARKCWKAIEAIIGAHPEAADEEGNKCMHVVALSELPRLTKNKEEWEWEDYDETNDEDDASDNDGASGEDESGEGNGEDDASGEEASADDHLEVGVDVSWLESLVKDYPQMLKEPNSKGSLPFHLAIKSGKKWGNGVDLLREAYPDAIKQRDGDTGLYPFMLAAMSRNKLSAVDLTYRLLCEFPGVEVMGTKSNYSGNKRAPDQMNPQLSLQEGPSDDSSKRAH
jgi:hypothetical protein